MNHGKRVMAVAMVACLLATAIGGGLIVEESDESDGFIFIAVPVGIALKYVIVACVASAVMGVAAGYAWGHDVSGGDQTAATRNAEALAVAREMTTGMTYYDNALANYGQIWGLTNEHWIRQAELSASFLWSADGGFDPDAVISSSGAYCNSAHMVYNASAQVSKHFDSLDATLDTWNGMDTYRGMMTLGYAYGNHRISSTDSFGGDLLSVVNVTSDQKDSAYIGGKELWVFGGPAQMTSQNGTVLSLNEGLNVLSDIEGFEDGIYDLQKDRRYAGTILSTFGADSAKVYSGFVAQAGDSAKLAMYNDGKIVIDDVQYTSFDLRITPEGGSVQTIDLMPMLSNYESMIHIVEGTLSDAVSSSNAVWNIYDKAGETSSYLTTLAVPNSYHGMDLSVAQREVMTVAAMEQLSDYYAKHSDTVKTGGYKLSDGSMQLFCRGNLIDPTGDVLYENVIFTPFYYTEDQTIVNGRNVQTQNSIVAIWSSNGVNLSGWDGSSDMEECELVTMSPGSEIYVSEMMMNGIVTDSADLELKDIDIIEGDAIDPNPVPEPNKGQTNYLQIILVVIGIIAVAGGVVFRRTDIVIGGILCLGIGLLFGTTIWNWIRRL